ncbi:MAG: ribosome biogenesis protein ytm1, partial [Ramalina farinacea]|nr:ribosome biogenesis protein ytm1 [Ramalina farinacea]
MPSLTSHDTYAHAILDHVQTGAYPEEEDVVSAELPAAGLPVVKELIEQSRRDLETEVQRHSQEAAPDIDGWIVQAKQLRNDVQGLHNESRQIVEEAAHGSSLEGNVHDAGSQIRLLNEELTFNHGIEASLKRLQAIRQDLDNIQQAILEDHLPEATHQIRDVEAQGLLQGSPPASRISAVFSARCSELRNDIAARLTQSWNGHIVVDHAALAITLRHDDN